MQDASYLYAVDKCNPSLITLAMRRLGQLVVTPTFWSEPRSPLALALAPLGQLVSLGARVREAMAPAPFVAPVPVVCVGGAVAGGSGKTPVALSLAAMLRARGLRLHLLTRGYGGAATGPLRVRCDVHDSATVGDEALMLAAVAPTWVAAARGAAAAAACASEPPPELLLMDDGLQHHTLKRDLGLLVVDALQPLGNGRVLPAGPLREPFDRTLARSHALVAVTPFANDPNGAVAAPPCEAALRASLALPPNVPLLRASLHPAAGAAEELAGRRVVAFTGTARPHRFFRTLRALGCSIAEEVALPDHAPLPPPLLRELRERAAARSALLATTSKDAARLGATERDGVHVLPMELRWEPEAEAALNRLIEPLLGHAGADDGGGGGAHGSGTVEDVKVSLRSTDHG